MSFWKEGKNFAEKYYYKWKNREENILNPQLDKSKHTQAPGKSSN